MMILLVASSMDIAALNIADKISQICPFKTTNRIYQENPVYLANINGNQVTYVTLKKEAVTAQYLADDFPDAELIVFVSRHSSQSGTPTLSVHTPGNFGHAELGGLTRQVSVSPAKAMQTALKTMNRLVQETKLAYKVSYECTHHGPSLNVPTMFVELGSSPLQWGDQKAAAIVAQAALAAISNFDNAQQSASMGLGGTHYNQKFTSLALKDEVIFGHMVPKYAIAQIDDELLLHCIERTQEKITSVILDWKGIKSEDKPKLLAFLEKLPLQIQKV